MSKSFYEITNNRRTRIDGIIQSSRLMTTSAELTIAYRALQNAKHALGNAVELAGSTNPYKVVDKVKDIPPTENVAFARAFLPSDDQLKNINTIREIIQGELDRFESEYNLHIHSSADLVQVYLYEHHKQLASAKNWFGEALGVMREEHKKKEAIAAIATKPAPKKKAK